MKPIAVLDFETDPFKKGRIPRVFAAGFYDGKTYEGIWGSHDVVCSWACNKLKKFNGYVYAHNGGKFDWFYIFGHDPRNFVGEVCSVIGSRLVSVKYGEATLRDSWNLLSVPLAKLGGKKEIDIQKLEKNCRNKHRAEIMEYLKADCVSLFDGLVAFIDKYGFHLTLASAAFNKLKEIEQIKIPEMTQMQDAEFRKYYFGGHVEVFKKGIHKGNFLQLDINSAYPFAMTHEHAFTTNFIPSRTLPKNGVEQCFIELECESDGALPVRGKDGSLSFPHGIVHSYCTGWEYVMAVRLKLIRDIKIIRVEIPQETRNFKKFVKVLYQEKLDAEDKGDKVARELAKLGLNAPYGKMAQNPREFRDYIFAGRDEHYEGPWKPHLEDAKTGLKIYSKPAEGVARFFNVATGASITGFVRAQLMEAKTYVTSPYYCDTDGLVCKSAGRLKMGRGLGEWKVEMKCDELRIAGKKLYAFRGSEKVKCKKTGRMVKPWKVASKGAKLDERMIKEICEGKTVFYEFEAPNFSIKKGVSFVERHIKMTAK